MKELVRSLAVICFVIALSGVGIYAQRDYTFEGRDSSNPTSFFIPGNWICTIDPCTFPSADDTARIGKMGAGGYTIYSPKAQGTATVKNLFILNGSALEFTNFTTTGTFNLGDLPTSAATVTAIGSGAVFNNNGTMSVITTHTGLGSALAGSFTLFNNGTFNLNKLTVAGQTIVNQPFASIFIGDFVIGSGGWTFNNLGFLNKPSSPGTAGLNLVAFTNSGTVEVGNGTLNIGLTGSTITSNCGRFSTISATGILILSAAVTANPCPTARAAFITPPGDVATNFYGPGPIRIQNNINFNGGDIRFGFAHPTSGQITGGNVEFQSDSMLGNGNLRVVANAQNPTTFTWLTGQIGGTGFLDIDAGGLVNINPPSSGSVNLNGRTVNNNGTVIWTGGNIGNPTAPITFNNNGIFEFRNNNNFSGLSASVFNNAGIFRKTIGTGTTSFNFRFNSSGAIDVQTGGLRFTSAAPNNHSFSGGINIAAGAFVEFASSTGGFNFNPGANFTGDGEIRVNFGATATVNNFALPVRNFFLDGGNVNTGGASSAFNVSGTSSRFDSGNFFLPRFNNLSGANTRLGGTNFTFAGTRVENQGTLLLQSNVFWNSGSSLSNFGTINAAHNTSLRQNEGAGFNFTNFGNLRIGSPHGTLFMDGNAFLTGIWDIDISGTTPGTQHDQFRIFAGTGGGTGTGSIGGTLNVSFLNGFVPAGGQFFQIVTCANGCSGQFVQINGVNVAADRIVIPGYGTNAVSLITTTISQSINPPTLQAAKTGSQNSFVFGRFMGAPNTQYLISLYRACDSTSNNFGTRLITTDASGNATFQVNFPFPLALGSFISARATDANNLTSNLSNCIQVRRGLLFDRNGDGLDDIGVFRPENGTWYTLTSSTGQRESVGGGQFSAVQFGVSTDKIIPGDYDGDGKADLAVFRPSNGFWYILNSSNNSFTFTQFGVTEDIPAASDYDGDGRTDIAVFRSSAADWYIMLSGGGIRGEHFGATGDRPVVGDYDGDGRSDLAVWRPSDRIWYLQRSSMGFTAVQFGLSTDYPAQSDYDGDSRTDVAVYRASQGTWYILNSTTGFVGTQFGASEDLPAPGDYDGDGRSDIAVFRPSTGIWYLLRSTQGFSAVQFGQNGDRPVAGGYIPPVP